MTLMDEHNPLHNYHLCCVYAWTIILSTASILDFSFLDTQLTGSQSTLNQVGSVSSMSSVAGGGRRYPRSRRYTKHRQSASSQESSGDGSEPGSIISEVARAQSKPSCSGNFLSATATSSPDPAAKYSDKNLKKLPKQQRSKERLLEAGRGMGAMPMTPIREFDEESERSPEPKTSKMSVDPTKSHTSMVPGKSIVREVGHSVTTVTCQSLTA